MSTLDKVKDFFGMNPDVLAAGEEYFEDEYEAGDFHAPGARHAHGHHDDERGISHSRPSGYRAERYGVEYAEGIRPGGFEREEADVMVERPRRYRAAAHQEAAFEAPTTRSMAPVRGSVALKPEVEEFEDYDDGLVVRPETVLERPRGYGDGKSVGVHLREDKPVVLDLSLMSNADARRMVDFSAGLVVALDGKMHKLADRERTFFMAPAGLDLTEAEIREEANRAFRR